MSDGSVSIHRAALWQTLDKRNEHADTAARWSFDDRDSTGVETRKSGISTMSHLHQARSFVRGARSPDPSQEGEQRPVGGFPEPLSKRVVGLGRFWRFLFPSVKRL